MFRRLVAILPPIILAAYSVLVLYAQNINELEIGEILPILGSVTIGASLCVALLAIVFRDARKVGIIGSLLTICVLFYGLFFSGLDDILDGKAWHKLFFPIYTLLLIAIAWFSTRTTDRMRMANTLVLVISVVLIATPVFRIVQYQMFEVKKVISEPLDEKAAVHKQNDNSLMKRSVYYLIFDRYAANHTLNRNYDFDNEAFLNFLLSKGFYVATNSYANYTKTAHSLASSLNMQYLDHLSKDLGGGSEDWKPLHRMIKDFKVWRVLKHLGYSYIHLGSWWGGTRKNEFANEVYSIDPNSEFVNLYFKNTVLLLNREFISKSKDFMGGNDYDRQCRRVIYKFKKLNELAERKGRFFVFAHMLIPHDPFVFNEQGRCMTKDQSESRTRNVNFVGQIKYVNRRLEQLINGLLSAETKPIIIIQSDEGPFPERYRTAGKKFDWRDATKEELQEKFRILNALYLPGVDHGKLHTRITPVNTFRIIFSEYFGLKYELLPDRSFSFYDEYHLYDFFEVTTSVE